MTTTYRCRLPFGRSLPEQVRGEVCKSATETSETILKPRAHGCQQRHLLRPSPTSSTLHLAVGNGFCF